MGDLFLTIYVCTYVRTWYVRTYVRTYVPEYVTLNYRNMSRSIAGQLIAARARRCENYNLEKTDQWMSVRCSRASRAGAAINRLSSTLANSHLARVEI